MPPPPEPDTHIPSSLQPICVDPAYVKPLPPIQQLPIPASRHPAAAAAAAATAPAAAAAPAEPLHAPGAAATGVSILSTQLMASGSVIRLARYCQNSSTATSSSALLKMLCVNSVKQIEGWGLRFRASQIDSERQGECSHPCNTVPLPSG